MRSAVLLRQCLSRCRKGEIQELHKRTCKTVVPACVQTTLPKSILRKIGELPGVTRDFVLSFFLYL